MKTFLATTGTGLARVANVNDQWSVEFMLTDQDVSCLTADPLTPNMVYAGMRG